MVSILNFEREELRQWLAAKGWPGYRADQVLQWVYGKGAAQWQAMSNLPAGMRDGLAGELALRLGNRRQRLTGADGTVKLLLQWPDSAHTETVYIPNFGLRIADCGLNSPMRSYQHGDSSDCGSSSNPKSKIQNLKLGVEAKSNLGRDAQATMDATVCVSSQVGCPVGCVFCASGQGGLERSLGAGEIVEQVMWAREELAEGGRISHVVVMGMGEPLANYEQVLKGVRILNAPWGLGIGARHITISTVGLPEQIRRLAHEPLQITLAVSLHAADDALRQRLIPWAKKISIGEIFSAIDYYYDQTHREVTLEYVLLAGVNAAPADAERLAELAQSSRCNVNLINYNQVSATEFRPADKAATQAFLERLRRRGVNAHLRASRGGEIEAACGQLRKNASR